MSVRESTRSPRPGASAHDVGTPVSGWTIAAAVLAVLAVLAAVAVVVVSVTDDGGRAGAPIESPSATDEPAPVEPPLAALPEEVEAVDPSGRVAYVTADGRLLLGTGAEAPVELAADAAVGAADIGAAEVAPTADLVAYVREDGALVALPAGGGAPTVLAADVALDALGGGSVLAWDPTGSQVAYIAEGTEDMALPRPETPQPLSGPDVFRVPLPTGVVGNVVKVVDRTGVEVNRIGDPTTRSMVSVTTSQSDDLMILESVAPDTGQPYTLLLATSGSPDELPTVLSADDPAFAPDGSFVVAVGPDKGGRELLRIETDQLARTTLVSTDRICHPTVSPDSTRIVYGTGEDCSKLHLVSSRGGQPVDITPPARPGDASFAAGGLGWTPEGRFVTFADCRSTDGPLRCGGPVTFLDPDRRHTIAGPEASTVAPVRQPLLQDLQLDLVLRGPLTYDGTFPVDTEAEGETRQLGEDTGLADLQLVDGERELRVEVQVERGVDFAAGRLTVRDPEAGVDRSLLVLGTPSIIGIRVVSLTGMWVTTDDLPFASGEFRLALRRR